LIPIGRIFCHIERKMRLTETVETRFQRFEIWKSATATEFRVAGAIHAAHHRRRLLTGLAWDIIAAGSLLCPAGPPQSILMLGLAGGTSCRVLRHLLPNCKITAIDIDAELIELAHQHMDLEALNIDIITTDAYPWLAINRRTFDVVFDDIYLAGKTDVFRSREWNPELLGHLRRAVAPGGVLGVNLVTGSGHRTMQSHTRKIVHHAFPKVRSVRTPGSMNEVLIAGNEVATHSRLDGYTSQFHHWQDRIYWEMIEVRKLT
jgi:spermidine synthase